MILERSLDESIDISLTVSLPESLLEWSEYEWAFSDVTVITGPCTNREAAPLPTDVSSSESSIIKHLLNVYTQSSSSITFLATSLSVFKDIFRICCLCFAVVSVLLVG